MVYNYGAKNGGEGDSTVEIERMQAIFGLELTQKYVLELFNFVAAFPALEERMKAELDARDHKACFKTALDICTGLKKIHAGDFANEFYKTIQNLQNKEHEEIEMHIANFLVYVAMLTIDIQTALFEHDSQKAIGNRDISKSAIAQKLTVEKELIIGIDDNMMFLLTLRSYLTDTGFNLVNYVTIEDSLEYLMKHRPAIIFLGIEMPKLKLNGFELAKKIRMLGHDAPIVFLTSNASEGTVLKAMEIGAAGVIVKPATQNSVIQILEKLVGLPEKPPPPEPKKKPETPDNSPELPDFAELKDLPS